MMFSPTLMTSNNSKKNAKQQLQALIALEVSRGNINEDEIVQKLLINSSQNNIHKLIGQMQKQQSIPRTSEPADSNKKFDELFGDDDDTDEENDQNDGVVWNCNDDDDNDQDDEKDEILFINDGQDYYDENENFQRQEDEDEKQLHELGFLNKRHALFCCANVEPDPREYEMWSQNYHQQQHQHQRCDSSMTKRSSVCSTPLYNHHQQTTTERTSNSSFSVGTSPTNTKQIHHHHWKEIIQQQQQQEQNFQNHTNNSNSNSISPQHLFGFKQSQQQQQQRPLVSFPELIEFEHGPAIVNRIPHEVVKKQLSVDDSLRLLSRIFSEAVESGASARILCECIIGLEKIIAFVMTHPTLSTSSVAENAVKLLVHRMFLDILPVWHLVQTSPVVVAASVDGCSSSSVYDVLNIFIETFLTGGKGGRKVVNLVTKKFSEESVRVLRAWRQRAHPFARLALKKIFAMKNVVEQNNQSAVMEELLKLAV